MTRPATPSIRHAALAAIALAALPAAVAAQPFNQADRDRDRYVTLDEALSVVPRLAPVHFRKFDRDGDGVLSRGEFAAFSAFADLMYE